MGQTFQLGVREIIKVKASEQGMRWSHAQVVKLKLPLLVSATLPCCLARSQLQAQEEEQQRSGGNVRDGLVQSDLNFWQVIYQQGN